VNNFIPYGVLHYESKAVHYKIYHEVDSLCKNTTSFNCQTAKFQAVEAKSLLILDCSISIFSVPLLSHQEISLNLEPLNHQERTELQDLLHCKGLLILLPRKSSLQQ
jgi:hypothetical protein